jgi:hypothetical protein
VYVEVRRTMTAGAADFLTMNEVESARAHRDQMALSVTRSVVVTSTSGGYPVPGGRKPCSDRGTWTPGT